MKFYDVAAFDVDMGLQKRLGYSKIYSIGKDFTIQSTTKQSQVPIIVKSKDSNNLMRSIKDSNVYGIIFEDNFLTKKVVEKISDTGKIIFIPISRLLWIDVWERHTELSKIRKILYAAHSLKAKVAIITLADNRESLLSKDQMKELATMLMDTKNSKFKIFGGELNDN